ncbi:MAG: diguanylate cyclase [Clostridia bacterium]|nr:diguanylate cyclase [Clostridia bacterium]
MEHNNPEKLAGQFHTDSYEALRNEYNALHNELKDTRLRLDLLLDSIVGGLFSYDVITGKFDYIGKGVLSMFHCDERQFRERYFNLFELMVSTHDREAVMKQIDNQLPYYQTIELTYRANRFSMDDSLLWIYHKARLFTDHDGRKKYYVVITDITEQKLIQDELNRANQKLYEERERNRLIGETIDEIQIDYDVKADIMTYLRFSKREKINVVKNFMKDGMSSDFIYPDDYDNVKKEFSQALTRPVKQAIEYRTTIMTGEYLWVRLNYASFEDKQHQMIKVFGILKDITEEKREQEELMKQIQLDPMTGILNKVSTQTAIEEYMQQYRTFGDHVHALIAIDTDYFKDVNDTFGHLFGDEVIMFVVKTLQKIFDSEDIIGRTGGDEFLVFMKDVRKETAIKRACYLNSAINKEFVHDGKSVQLSCSIGLAFTDHDKIDYMTLFQRADKALYLAKEEGRNCYHVYENE